MKETCIFFLKRSSKIDCKQKLWRRRSNLKYRSSCITDFAAICKDVSQCNGQVCKMHTSVENIVSIPVAARIPDVNLTLQCHQSGIYCLSWKREQRPRGVAENYFH